MTCCQNHRPMLVTKRWFHASTHFSWMWINPVLAWLYWITSSTFHLRFECVCVCFFSTSHLFIRRHFSFSFNSSLCSALFFKLFLFLFFAREQSFVRECTRHHVQHYMRDLFLALSFLHDNHLVHRDVKPSNFLFDLATYRAWVFSGFQLEWNGRTLWLFYAQLCVGWWISTSYYTLTFE